VTTGSLAGTSPRESPGKGGLAAGASVLLLGVLTTLSVAAAVTGASLGGGAEVSAEAAGSTPSALASREIPPQYLRLYEQAAQRNAIDWAILAGIGKVECDHGRDTDPSCTREGATNSAGAGGPMQFIASTWATYGVDADGDGRADRWDPVDAIYAAANFLAHAGAPSDYPRAILAYNHAGWCRNGPRVIAARPCPLPPARRSRPVRPDRRMGLRCHLGPTCAFKSRRTRPCASSPASARCSRPATGMWP